MDHRRDGRKYTEHLVQEGGYAVPRSYQTYNASGSAIVNQQLAKLKEIKQEAKLQVYVERLLRDADGRVKGLQVRENYVFPRAGSDVKYIQAKRAWCWRMKASRRTSHSGCSRIRS